MDAVHVWIELGVARLRGPVAAGALTGAALGWAAVWGGWTEQQLIAYAGRALWALPVLLPLSLWLSARLQRLPAGTPPAAALKLSAVTAVVGIPACLGAAYLLQLMIPSVFGHLTWQTLQGPLWHNLWRPPSAVTVLTALAAVYPASRAGMTD